MAAVSRGQCRVAVAAWRWCLAQPFQALVPGTTAASNLLASPHAGAVCMCSKCCRQQEAEERRQQQERGWGQQQRLQNVVPTA